VRMAFHDELHADEHSTQACASALDTAG